MSNRHPNLPSDELAMLATVEAASNAGRLTTIDEPPRFKDQRIRLAALWSLVSQGWIEGEQIDGKSVFWTERAKVFKPDSYEGQV